MAFLLPCCCTRQHHASSVMARERRTMRRTAPGLKANSSRTRPASSRLRCGSGAEPPGRTSRPFTRTCTHDAHMVGCAEVCRLPWSSSSCPDDACLQLGLAKVYRKQHGLALTERRPRQRRLKAPSACSTMLAARRDTLRASPSSDKSTSTCCRQHEGRHSKQSSTQTSMRLP